MKAYNALRFAFVVTYCVAGSTLFGCGSNESDGRGPPGDYPESVTEPLAVHDAAAGLSLEDWKRAAKSSPPPKEGCFTQSFPSNVWTQVPCGAPPDPTRFPASTAVGAAAPNLAESPTSATAPTAASRQESSAHTPSSGGLVGNGDDYIATVSGTTIVEADGTFPSASNLTSEWDNAFDQVNMYDLQINSNMPNTAACNGYPQCYIWQQFEYSSVTFGGVFIEYWLFEYGQVNGTSNTCPSGWGQFGLPNADSTITCHAFSAVTPVPVQPATNLQSLELGAFANHAGFDIADLYVGSTHTFYSASGGASKLDLYSDWSQVEFNIFGDMNLHQAMFNPDASLEIHTEITRADGLTTAPTCQSGVGVPGLTGETTNFTLGSCTQAAGSPGGSIDFMETSPNFSSGTFWLQNAGYTGSPIGDWMSGSYKGQCAPGSALVGISASATPGPAEDVACSPWTNLLQNNSCRSVAFDPGNNPNPWGSSGVDTSDWDLGYYKAECNNNEYVAGVSQSTSGQLDGILCCPKQGGDPDENCEVEVYADQNSADYASPDWDVGYSKGECAQDGHVVLGVSTYPSGSNAGAPHALLCCEVPY